MEFRMSSVCVVAFSGCFFFAAAAPLPTPTLTWIGVLYLTRDAMSSCKNTLGLGQKLS